MSERTPGPWEQQPFDVTESGVAIIGLPHGGLVAWATLSPTELDINDPERAKANAAFIVRAVNSHDALVKALERAKVDLDASLTIMEFNGTAPAYGIRQTLEIVNAALATAGAKK